MTNQLRELYSSSAEFHPNIKSFSDDQILVKDKFFRTGETLTF